ncbi:hypothetical protein OAS14_02750 [Alphaproteobacteria bacterium]|nr:hypothetical protein [Alphaproteobacteria bacterium]
MILASGQSHLLPVLRKTKKRLAVGNWQGLASSLLNLLKEGNFSQVVNPLHNSINCDSVSELVD